MILGRLSLPDTVTQEADINRWVTREAQVSDPFQAIDFQAAYIRDLLQPTDYPAFDVEGVAEIFKAWEHHKEADILGYRNQGYRSTLTGTLAPAHHTPWMEAMDDSLEAFLGEPG